MLIIVAHHFSVHGGFSFGTDTITIPHLWVQFIQIGGKIGVDVFVLISGYFLINISKVKVSRILRFWLQIFFYSAVIYFVFVVAGLEPFGIKAFIKAMFPISFRGWWFASTYFVLYLLSPYLNMLLKKLDRRTYIGLLLLTFVLWCIIPTFTGQGIQSNGLLWFMFLYAVSGYIRLWHNKPSLPNWAYHIIAVGMTLLTFLSAVVFDIIGTKYAFVGSHATFFYDMQKLPILIVSVAMLLGFKNLKIGQSKFVNTIAAATFGVYLIHDNCYVRPFLWIDVFKNATYSNTAFLVPYSCAVILIVFLGCTLIEIFRLKVIEPLYMRGIKKVDKTWDIIVKKVEIKFSEIEKSCDLKKQK